MDRVHFFGVVAPDIEPVMFLWSNKFGHCYECGSPAAYTIGVLARGTLEECNAVMAPGQCANPEEHKTRPEDLRCAVCAAMAAAEGGETITWLWREEFEFEESDFEPKGGNQ